MGSIYDLKPAFQARLRPLAAALAARGVRANQVTIAALLLSLAAGAAVLLLPGARLPLLLLPPVLLVRMALNALDGMLAREHGQKSDLGALLNELGDILADAALYLPVATAPGVFGPLVVAIVVLAGASETIGCAALLIGASRRYDGPMGKSDRAFAFAAIALLLGLGVPAGGWLQAALLLIAVLLAVTIANRMRRAIAEAHP
jgi:CDP-diacylglycerol--glycerol-3-phosphate 3-phosphatidyltransferase